MERNPSAIDRVSGLDSIRFVCALWVFFGHGAAPSLPNPFPPDSLFHFALRGFYNNSWSGPSAVIVFFVISGFCIHFPFAGSDRRPRLAEFYTRRFLRLLVPVAVAIPLGSLFGVRLALFHDSILWSLLAELIYYVCYPGLRWAQLRLRGWGLLLLGSYGAAFAVILTNPFARDYPSYGSGLNWVLGLPCWLLGCILAEAIRQKTTCCPTTLTIWVWRAGVFGAAWLCSALRFHSPLGYPWTLNLFAVLAALWLHREILYRQRITPPKALEWAGAWSYSLYLLHTMAPSGAVFATLPFVLGPASRWAATCLFVFVFCYAFYLLVERPSHLLARRVAKIFQPSEKSEVASNPS